MIFSCPHCYTKAAPGAKDCGSCGRKMVRDCPHCAEEIAVKAAACKYCGEDVEPAKQPLRRVEPTSAPKPEIEFMGEVRPICDWEDTSKGVVRRWWGTFFESSLHPRRFFETLPKSSGHKWPIGYAYGLLAQGIALAALALVLGSGVYVAAGGNISTNQAWAGAGLFTLAIPASFVLVTAALYVKSLLWHVLLWVLGAKGGFQGTLRVIGYSSGAALWNFIPGLGGLLSLILHYQGFRRVHGLSGPKALFAVVFPALLGLAAIVALLAAGCCAPDDCCPPPQPDSF
jgi:hypothetical protein